MKSALENSGRCTTRETECDSAVEVPRVTMRWTALPPRAARGSGAEGNDESGSTVIEVNHVTDSHLQDHIGCIGNNVL